MIETKVRAAARTHKIIGLHVSNCMSAAASAPAMHMLYECINSVSALLPAGNAHTPLIFFMSCGAACVRGLEAT